MSSYMKIEPRIRVNRKTSRQSWHSGLSHPAGYFSRLQFRLPGSDLKKYRALAGPAEIAEKKACCRGNTPL
jgi:hypothetical protein